MVIYSFSSSHLTCGTCVHTFTHAHACAPVRESTQCLLTTLCAWPLLFSGALTESVTSPLRPASFLPGMASPSNLCIVWLLGVGRRKLEQKKSILFVFWTNIFVLDLSRHFKNPSCFFPLQMSEESDFPPVNRQQVFFGASSNLEGSNTCKKVY